MSAPLTYGIAAKAKNADCAAFFFNWVATNEKAREIDVAVGGSNPGGPPDLPVPPAAAGSVTNETLAAGADVAKDNGAMDFIANATGLDLRPGLDARAPEDGRRQAGRRRPAEGRPGRVREGAHPVTHAADEADRGRAIARPATAAAGRRPSAADPPDAGGSAGRPSWAGCSCCRPSSCTRCSSCSRCALTVQYSLYRWDGVGPATWVGLVELRDGPERAQARRDAVQRVPARRVLQPRSRWRSGLVTASGHPPGRDAAGWGRSRRTVLFLPQVIPLVAAGIIWGRLLSLSGLDQPGPDRDRPRRRHPGLARRLRHRAAGGRAHRRSGSCSASAPCCC